MWYLWILLFLSYGALTWRSLREASSPALSCQASLEKCFRPAVVVGDFIYLQLELYQPRNDPVNETKEKRFRWIPVDTCRIPLTIPKTGQLPESVTSSSNTLLRSDNATFHQDIQLTEKIKEQQEQRLDRHCEVSLPAFARHRSSDADSVQPLKARFLMFKDEFHVNNNGMQSDVYKNLQLLGKTDFFFLTRIKKRKPKASLASLVWNAEGIVSSSTSSDMSSTESLSIANDTANSIHNETQRNDDDNENSKTMWIPYLKFGKSPVRIRFVAEDRDYAVLQRTDGLLLTALNHTTYTPIFYVDELSLQHSAQIELAPVQENKPPIKLHIKFGSISPAVDAINRQVHGAFQTAESMLPGPELDELRYFLQDERLYRFALTQLISYVHMWLDYMAFRDEIRFYRRRQNLSGVSTSSVVTRLVCSVIIMLYLLDGGGTSWVVLISLFSSCGVDSWKVWKLLRPKLSIKFPFFVIRQLQNPKEQETAEYDRIAFRYLSMILYPVVIAWSLYALKHYEYKSWYSWLISNLANAVYTFGFISLCPQLYVNYRLKSVAHLPCKVFMYKIFNTFVDDAFAWLIEMPMKHRIMTLRDDVVFLGFLVQFYMYRVDKSRTNEFGYSYEENYDENVGTERRGIENLQKIKEE